jgi:hypothetical protein
LISPSSCNSKPNVCWQSSQMFSIFLVEISRNQANFLQILPRFHLKKSSASMASDSGLSTKAPNPWIAWIAIQDSQLWPMESYGYIMIYIYMYIYILYIIYMYVYIYIWISWPVGSRHRPRPPETTSKSRIHGAREIRIAAATEGSREGPQEFVQQRQGWDQGGRSQPGETMRCGMGNDGSHGTLI